MSLSLVKSCILFKILLKSIRNERAVGRCAINWNVRMFRFARKPRIEII